MIAVGKKATKSFWIVTRSRINDRAYRTTTESIAPSWIAISKLLRNSVSDNRSKVEARIRCPVEDISRNSVIPSTIPRMIASNNLMGVVARASRPHHQWTPPINFLIGLSNRKRTTPAPIAVKPTAPKS